VNNIKVVYRRTRAFAKKHPVITASVVSGVVGYKVGHNRAIKSVLDDVTALSYKWGTEAGALELQRDVLLDYVNAHDLGTDVREFIASRS
jgi:hypothetical protein